MNIQERDNITIAAVGDIAFVGEKLRNPKDELFINIKPLFEKCDLVIGNLESPLVEKGSENPDKCTLKSSPGWAEILKHAGISYVSLANNHMMDYGLAGLKSTWKALNDASILYSGSGNCIAEANLPKIIKVKGCQIAILAYSSVVVSSRCYAEDNSPGVAFFDLQEVLYQIQSLREQVDFIILCIHWGVEHYRYPTPEQKTIAKKLAKAGTDLILGHHPHTLQGTQKIENSLVVYSLGNFIFDDFEWKRDLPDGTTITSLITMTENNRIGSVLRVNIKDRMVDKYEHLLTNIDSAGSLEWVKSQRKIAQSRRLSNLLNIPGYSYLWKIYSIIMEWKLRISDTISIRKILKDYKKIRPRHIISLFNRIMKSAKIVTGKSTNPYE